MTWDEYNKLFHQLQLNRVAFKRLMDCDEEVLKLVNTAIAAEREACAKVVDDWYNSLASEPEMAYIAAEIRSRT